MRKYLEGSVVAQSRYHAGIFLEDLRKITKETQT
jgi:hypothetical protein